MPSSPEKNYEIGQLLDLYGALLPERQREVADYCRNDDLSLSEAAQECGITRQGVRDALMKAEEQLRAYERALGLLEKQKRTEEWIKALKSCVQARAARGEDPRDLEELIDKLPF